MTFLRFQEIAVYLNLLKQRFKCRVCDLIIIDT
ncbi:hypothetical protein [Staphylococcus schleiferi]